MPPVSLIWKYFLKNTPVNFIATCKICRDILVTPQHSISTLQVHLKSKHKDISRQFEEKKKRVAEEELANTTKDQKVVLVFPVNSQL